MVVQPFEEISQGPQEAAQGVIGKRTELCCQGRCRRVLPGAYRLWAWLSALHP